MNSDLTSIQIFTMKKFISLFKLKLLAGFCLISMQVTAQNIDRVEYFFNTDPGFGNAVDAGITAAPDIPDFAIAANISALNYGFNTFYVRGLSSNGNWSTTNQKTFVKQLVNATNISKLEYFVDTDPGFGLATNVTITAAPDVSNVAIPVDISGYNNGFHILYVRTLDDNGRWVINNRWAFVKQQASSTNINKLEYFVDTDPGYGNADNVAITSSPDITDVIIPVDLTGFSNGFHTVYLRSRDDAGRWSIVSRWVFVKESAASSNINKLEYFVDTDPGYGNATNVAITAGANLADVIIPIDVTAYSYGFHQVYIRSKDNAGKWSITNHWVFVKDKVQLALIKGEYFFDTDPGFGNGTPIPSLPQTANLSDFIFSADLTGLPNAPHILFIRSLDDWSITNAFAFTKATVVPVKLLNFFAKAVNKTSLLNWQTVTESNNDRFEIERSTDGISFIKIGSVKGAGNSNILQHYSFTDNNPVKGINFYRLRQVDLDAGFVFSETRRVDFNDTPLFELNNNPSNGTNIIVKTNLSNTVLNIFDISGKKLQQTILAGNIYELPVSSFANGIYLAALIKDGKIIATEKFVVSR